MDIHKFKNAEAVWNLLKKQDIKKTIVRQNVIDLFFLKHHWTIPEMVEELKNKNKKINISSLYNTVLMLLQHRIIVSYSFGTDNQQVFELEGVLAYHVFFEEENKENNYFREVKPTKKLYNEIVKSCGFIIGKKNAISHIQVEVHVRKK